MTHGKVNSLFNNFIISKNVKLIRLLQCVKIVKKSINLPDCTNSPVLVYLVHKQVQYIIQISKNVPKNNTH